MVLGITGGVGSGKSTVLELMERDYGACVCKADELGHAALEKGTSCYEEICDFFGRGILSDAGEIQRNRLSEIVYGRPEYLQRLNDIVHPFVKGIIRQWIEENETKPMLVLESAILFESGCEQFCDEVWGIDAEEEIRIQRLIESRGYAKEKARAIIGQQMSSDERNRRCQKILYNNGDMAVLKQELKKKMALLQRYEMRNEGFL